MHAATPLSSCAVSPRWRRLAQLVLLNLALAGSLPTWAQANGPDPAPTQQGPGHSPRGGGFGVSISLGDVLRGAAALARAVNSQDDVVYESGQLLVLWPDAAQAAQGLAALAQREQLQPASRVAFEALGGELAVFQFSTQAEAERWRTQLRARYPGWTIDFNARAELLQAPQFNDGAPLAGGAASPSAPAVPAGQARLYAQRMLGLLPRPAVRPGEVLRIGVIDTGIDARLLAPGLQNQAWNGSRFALRSLLSAADLPAPPAHGTAVAQLLAGPAIAGTDFEGAAPAGPIWWATALRQTGERQSTHTVLIAQSLDWLLGQRVQLINLSAGGAGDDILKAVVGQVLERGVALVAAAGNRPDARPVYPAAYPGVWAVGAVDAARQRYAQGSQGAYLSFAAPGVDLWVPDAEGLLAAQAGGAVAGRYLSGSSFAAALATGVLAGAPAAFWARPHGLRLQRVCQTAQPTLPPQGCGLEQTLR